MRILLLSAYDADSHRRWHQGLRAHFPDDDWTLLTLPPRYFSWRIRGNSLSWAFAQRDLLQQHYDLIIATSMTDLSALRGMVPRLASTPTLVYFHENQFVYPHNPQHQRAAPPNVEPQILNLYTALCGDAIVFNTEFNRQTFLQGVADLLRRLPDHVPKGVVEQLTTRSTVIPVPLEDICFEGPSYSAAEESGLWPVRGQSRPLRLLWAARWEYDKGPELLLAILRQLQTLGVDFQLCLLGQKFRQSPPQFDEIQRHFAPQLVQFGHEPDPLRYRQWLATADMVLSTALHEFQGLAVLEAMAAGCIPVLPGHLSYPEIVGEQYLFDVAVGDIAQQAQRAAERILELQGLSRHRPLQVDVRRWSWGVQREHYRQLMAGLV